MTSQPSALVSGHGTTTIADGVVAKISGLAAREVAGVYALGGGTRHPIGALRERLSGGRAGLPQGIGVVVGEQQAAVEVDIVAEYGIALPGLAAGVRGTVITSVERMTGLSVTSVDISVLDVHLPDDGDDDGTGR